MNYTDFEPDNTGYVVTIFCSVCGNIVLLAMLFRISIRRSKEKITQTQEIVLKKNKPKSAQPDSNDRVRIGTKNADSLEQIVDRVRL